LYGYEVLKIKNCVKIGSKILNTNDPEGRYKSVKGLDIEIHSVDKIEDGVYTEIVQCRMAWDLLVYENYSNLE
jgi:hypothetical protein